ncbi:hypothetical protein DAPPUDRAFT_246405 [Daphnia pulex]|uniref:Uncharacterized protein n=1 Tax=Daphnia pulex TaxID=6669 RepID=E9GQE9_DAPPU|nr:hypothetical protein DAPPUDRAFT_246405 [Daphnia pulex]|eukprot:EFX78108.1 hypothetical protein DAPPUDRAFT_246405 [Daphnia pulex]
MLSLSYTARCIMWTTTCELRNQTLCWAHLNSLFRRSFLVMFGIKLTRRWDT